MNNGDLNRILNKLTAAANPLPDDGILPGQAVDPLAEDPCKRLPNIIPQENILQRIKNLKSEHGGRSNKFIREELSYRFSSYIMRYIKAFCRCRLQKKRMGTLSRDTGSTWGWGQMTREVTSHISVHGPDYNSSVLMANALSDLAQGYLIQVSSRIFPSGIDKDFCSDDMQGKINALDKSAVLDKWMATEFGSTLDDLYNILPSASVVTPDVVAPCAEPKVEIIEDYLVEQGLAIGVAGILAATALGLYLRGNRAAAVTLIATATAAVGGTATGAESVMNAVDTDYNRSVRFGGQQDCRDSNQTGSEMSEGD